MPLVVDSSFMLALLMSEEHSDFAARRLDDLGELQRKAPALIAWEIANVLWRKVRQGMLSSDERRGMLDAFQAFRVALDTPSPDDVLALSAFADIHGLTAYDAAYLEMALRLDAPLATLDGPLSQAARAEGLVVLSPFA